MDRTEIVLEIREIIAKRDERRAKAMDDLLDGLNLREWNKKRGETRW